MLLLCLLALLVTGCGSAPRVSSAVTDPYLYKDTRELVVRVESAANRLEEVGALAFEEFANDPQWRENPNYLFVYELKGTCVYHAANPSLVGRDMMNFRDALGKPVIELICEIGQKQGRNAAGWVFYQWEEQTEFQPRWKSSYVRKVVFPDGKVFVVGSGSSRLKIEKAFLQNIVDSGADLLMQKGTHEAFSRFREPSSRFYFLNTFVYVLDEKGVSLVDPAYPTLGGRDMIGFRDATGKPVVEEMLRKLKTADSAWSEFLWPRPGEMLPSRKLMYMRKVKVDGQTMLVGSDFYLATPIWMR